LTFLFLYSSLFIYNFKTKEGALDVIEAPSPIKFSESDPELTT